ncbi:FeoA family protein [Robertkochia flava]|uniref:FeoA family protein n=1 Tax=Robertkochia flava TaxID=3447986 RepID=UPI001CCED2F0|nr:FeoA family protein [Robertkochia marina]
MRYTIADLKRGQKAVIKHVDTDELPIKLLEMGCLPGNEVELIQFAPFQDPMYLNINGSYLAIRRETALQVEIQPIEQNPGL